MKLVIIVPCYNEEEVLPETTSRLTGILQRLTQSGQITEGRLLYVDDGSKDRTWALVKDFAAHNPAVCGLKLSRNEGHQQALWAGLQWAATHADAAISIDADLQDDAEAILPMVDYFHKGIDIVYGVRRQRTTDTFFKRNTALLFYRLMKALGGEIIYNHADFRLMSRRAMQALVSFPERNLFLRGLVPLVGYPTAMVWYDRTERFAGTSKYPFKKMLNFAIDGITSFSVRPLRYITYLGLVFVLLSFIAIIYALFSYASQDVLPGWTSPISSNRRSAGTIPCHPLRQRPNELLFLHRLQGILFPVLIADQHIAHQGMPRHPHGRGPLHGHDVRERTFAPPAEAATVYPQTAVHGQRIGSVDEPLNEEHQPQHADRRQENILLPKRPKGQGGHQQQKEILARHDAGMENSVHKDDFSANIRKNGDFSACRRFFFRFSPTAA